MDNNQITPPPTALLMPPASNESSLPVHHNRKNKLLIIGGLLTIALVLVVVLLKIVLPRRLVQKKVEATQSSSQTNTQATNTTSADGITLASLETAYDSYYAAGIKEFEPSKKQTTVAAFNELASGFAIDKKFFADKPSVLIGLGIANRYLNDQKNKDSYRNELYVLTIEQLKKVPSGITDQYFQTSNATDQATLQLFSSYKDATLTTKLSQSVASSGIESEIATNLKLSGPDKLAKYTLIAFDFDNSSSRQKEFAAKHYMFGAQPKMWVESVGDEMYILLAKNYAQSFVDNPNGSDRSSVIHEFVHAQSPFNRGDLGRAIEERRAEYFSGDKSAYYDAKQLFIYMEVFSGISVNDLLSAYPTDPASFYLNLYKKFGVEGANDMLASWPNVYLSAPSNAIDKTNKLSGGLDGAIKIALTIGAKDQTALNDRLKKRSDKLLSILKTKDKVLEDIANNLGDSYAMPSAAATMKDYVTKHY